MAVAALRQDRVLSDQEWAELSRLSGLTDEGERYCLDRFIAILRTKGAEELAKSPPRKVKRELAVLSNDAKRLVERVSKISDEAVDALGEVFGQTDQSGDARKRQVKKFEALLREWSGYFEVGCRSVSSGKTGRKVEILHAVISMVHEFLRIRTGKGLNRSLKIRSGASALDFAVKLCQIADPKLTRTQVDSAIKKSLKGWINDSNVSYWIPDELAPLHPWWCG